MKRIYLVAFLCFSVAVAKGQELKSNTFLKIQLKDRAGNDTSLRKKPDTLYLTLFEQGMGDLDAAYNQPREMIASISKDGLFHFQFTLTRPGYISVSEMEGPGKRIMYSYLAEPGDDVLLRIGAKPGGSKKGKIKRNDGYYTTQYGYPQDTFYFSGRGAAKYACRFSADNFAAFELATGRLVDTDLRLYAVPNHYDVSLDSSLAMLERFRGEVSPEAYRLLKADFAGKYELDKLVYLRRSYAGAEERQKKDSLLMQAVLRFYREDLRLRTDIDAEVAIQSNFYANVLIEKEWFGRKLQQQSTNLVPVIIDKYRGELRDKLLALYLLERYKYLPDSEALLKQAIAVVRTAFWKQRLEELGATMAGQKAYVFHLPDAEGNKISLEQFKGKVVFIDFWFTGCTACLGFYKWILKPVEEQFRGQDVVFITISVDRNKELWKKSIASGQYTSDKTINLYTGGKGDNHEVIKKNQVRGYPNPFIIDRNGKIFTSVGVELRAKDTLAKLIQNALDAK